MRALWSIGLVLGLAAPAAAEEPAGAEAVTELELITVIANKSERQLREVVGTVSIIDEEDLEARLARDLRDALRYEPGVSVVNDAARFGLQSLNIRGLDRNRVAIEIDGVPVAQAFAVGSFADAGRNYVDPVVLKRIEILRGPASTLYGSDALGGVVTYTTKDPADYLGANERGLALRSGYHGQDASAFATVAAAHAAGPFEALALYSRRDGHDTDNAASGPAADANPMDYTAENWIGKLVHRGERGQLRFSVDRNESETATDVRSAIGGPGKFATTTALLADDESERTRLSLDQKQLLGRGWADALTWRVFHQRSETLQRSRQSRSADERTPYATLRVRDFDYDREITGLELGFEKDLGGRRTLHRLLYGLEVTESDAVELRDGVEINLEDGSETKVIIGEELPVRDFPITRTRELGAYVQDEITFANSLTVIPGLRFEYYELDSRPDALWLADNPDTMPVGLVERSVSPKLGALYPIGERWTVFGQYARGFRSPPADDVNIGFTIPAFNFVALPNPDLEPETSDGFELGARHETPRTALSVVAYYNRYENLIESRVNLGVDPDTGFLVFQSQNRARATIYGLELRGEIALGALHPAMQSLHLHSSLAVGRGDDEERDEPLNSVDPAKLVAGIAYRPAGGRWSAELIGSFVAPQHRVDQSMGLVLEPPGYGVLDLVARWDVNDRARLNVGLFNLTDKRYWEWADVRGIPADDPLLELYTRPGFSASVSFTYQL